MFLIFWTASVCLWFILSFIKVILASGYYAAFRVTLVAKALEGLYDGAVHITTDYEVCILSDVLFSLHNKGWCLCNCHAIFPSDINHPNQSSHCSRNIKQCPQTHHFTTRISSEWPLRFSIGAVNLRPGQHVVRLCLQGKVVHQSYSIQSSFTQKVRLQQIRSLTEDIRFYYKRLRNNKDELEPRRKSKVVLHRRLWAPRTFYKHMLISFPPSFSGGKYLFWCQLAVWWSLLCGAAICA